MLRKPGTKRLPKRLEVPRSETARVCPNTSGPEQSRETSVVGSGGHVFIGAHVVCSENARRQEPNAERAAVRIAPQKHRHTSGFRKHASLVGGGDTAHKQLSCPFSC